MNEKSGAGTVILLVVGIALVILALSGNLPKLAADLARYLGATKLADLLAGTAGATIAASAGKKKQRGGGGSGSTKTAPANSATAAETAKAKARTARERAANGPTTAGGQTGTSWRKRLEKEIESLAGQIAGGVAGVPGTAPVPGIPVPGIPDLPVPVPVP